MKSRRGKTRWWNKMKHVQCVFIQWLEIQQTRTAMKESDEDRREHARTGRVALRSGAMTKRTKVQATLDRRSGRQIPRLVPACVPRSSDRMSISSIRYGRKQVTAVRRLQIRVRIDIEACGVPFDRRRRVQGWKLAARTMPILGLRRA